MDFDKHGNTSVNIGMQKEEKHMINKEKFGKGVKFERIRRITGYLVGTLEKWNNAKKAEERDRVIHSRTKKE